MKICFFGTYKRNYNRNSSLRDGLRLAGVEVIEIQSEFPDKKMELSEDFTVFSTIQRIARKIKAYVYLLSQFKEVISCDYIFVLHPGHLDLPFAWVLAKIAGVPLIFDTSISPYDTMFIGRSIAPKDSFKAKLVKFIESSLLKLPSKLFVDTDLMKKFIQKEFNVPKNKIFVIPLGANDQIYKPKKTTSSGKSTKVFFFGLYNPMHGAKYILEAAKLLKGYKEIKFTMLGDGYLKEDFMNYVKKNKLENVNFIGFVPEMELVKQIQNTDIMLGVFSNSPVFQRAIPNKVYAALACKKPLISADLPPLKEFFNHRENIYLCKPEDSNSLAEAIKTVTQDKLLRKKLTENGYKLYKEKFTTRQIGKSLVKGIES